MQWLCLYWGLWLRNIARSIFLGFRAIHVRGPAARLVLGPAFLLPSFLAFGSCRRHAELARSGERREGRDVRAGDEARGSEALVLDITVGAGGDWKLVKGQNLEKLHATTLTAGCRVGSRQGVLTETRGLATAAAFVTRTVSVPAVEVTLERAPSSRTANTPSLLSMRYG